MIFFTKSKDECKDQKLKPYHHLTDLEIACKLIEKSMVSCEKRGSDKSAHVLLHLLNESGKSDKMRGLSSILLLFRNEYNFNNTGARIFDHFYHMTLELIKSALLAENVSFNIFYASLEWTSKLFPKICKPLVEYRFYCMAIFHSQTRRHMIIRHCEQYDF